VNILSFPHGTAWRVCRASTTHAIVSAAGCHNDQALGLIMNVVTHEAVYLGIPGAGWVTPDRNIAAALTNISHGQLGRTLTLTSNACLDQGSLARGRVLLQIYKLRSAITRQAGTQNSCTISITPRKPHERESTSKLSKTVG
jgi:hypothetical protein